jgi:hypothetical protein
MDGVKGRRALGWRSLSVSSLLFVPLPASKGILGLILE